MKKYIHLGLLGLVTSFVVISAMYFYNSIGTSVNETENNQDQTIVQEDTVGTNKELSIETEELGLVQEISSEVAAVEDTVKPKPVAKSKPVQKDVQVQAPTNATEATLTSTVTCTGTFNAQLLCLVNQYRKSKGLNALVFDSKLNSTAYDHSAWMYKTKIFSHTGEGGSRFYERCWDHGTTCDAENLGRGYTSASALMTAWKNSYSHNANLLGKHNYMGAGLVGSYSTQLFR
jgi:uncharacterized protein YkwD